MIVASLITGVQEDDTKSFLAYRELREIAEEFAPNDFKLSFTGLTPVGAAILDALISDQKTLTIIGLVAGDSDRVLYLPQHSRRHIVRHSAGADSALGIWPVCHF